MLCFGVLVVLLTTVRAQNGIPEIRVHNGRLEIDQLGPSTRISEYVIGNEYTFEIYLDETTRHDYMVDSCLMNNEKLIGPYGCVECGSCFTQSIETESYNKPGAIKRTMITFIAQTTHYEFKCQLQKLDCSGCAERSCQRQDQLILGHYHSEVMHLSYPMAGYGGGAAGVWPWWLWLLILLLLLLLLCCLLALCFAAFMKRRRDRKAATAVAIVDNSGKDCAVGTDKVSVSCVGTDTQDMVKVQPAMILGAAELERHHHQQHHQNQYSRSQAEYDQGSVMAGGSYSLREGMVHEGYTRTLPRENYSTNDRYASRDRFERQSQDNARFTDRSSYRNFAYERDMGRVEPMDGYDEVETRERTYCLSDDDQEVVEKNVKRTHTTRYVTESREYEHDNEERMRGDEYHHATYTHSLPV